MVRDPAQLETMMTLVSGDKKLSLGLVDGQNIWKNNYENSLKLISRAIQKIGQERVMLAPSCSLIHIPCDLELETNEKVLSPQIKQWLAFARQKVEEVVVLKQLSILKGNIELVFH